MHTLCYQKRGLGVKYQVFLQERWFWHGEPTFSWEKDSFGPENLFLGKTKNTKNNFFLETIWPDSKKMVFWVFPRKKLVFLSKTIFFLRKSWLFGLKPLFCWLAFRPKVIFFARENQKNHLLRVWLKRCFFFFFVFLLFP